MNPGTGRAPEAPARARARAQQRPLGAAPPRAPSPGLPTGAQLAGTPFRFPVPGLGHASHQPASSNPGPVDLTSEPLAGGTGGGVRQGSREAHVARGEAPERGVQPALRSGGGSERCREPGKMLLGTGASNTVTQLFPR